MGKNEPDYLYYHKKMFAELREKNAKLKKADTEKLTQTQNELLRDKKSLETRESETSKKIKNLRLNLRRVRAMIGVWVLLPFLGGGAGYAMGSTNWQYKVTTKSYNMKTNEPVGNDGISYKTENFYFRVVVKKGLPWEKKKDGTGYIREVLEYEYIERNQNKDPDIESILQSVKPTYYREEKPALDENDLMDQPEIIISESNMDESDRKPDITFAIAFGLLCFLILSTLVSKNQIKGLKEDFDIKKLKEDLKNAKITRTTIKDEYIALCDRIVKFQEEHQEKSDIYNGIDVEIDPNLLSLVKKYAKKNPMQNN